MFDEIKPIFNISKDNIKQINKIEKLLESIDISNNIKKRNMLTKSKVRSIHSSLAIEANSLSIDDVSSIIQDKIVIGDRKEIQEVKNANELYEHVKDYNWRSEEDFIKAHVTLMRYFNDDNKAYRNHGEAIKKDNEIIYIAPESILVPSLMKSLFKYINESETHPLILPIVFHYYFVWIHPFTDGNGRIARFWVSLMLSDYNEKFNYIPFEEQIYVLQEEYYEAISKSHTNGNCNVFINFMLKSIENTLIMICKETNKLPLNKTQKKIIELIKKNEKITRKEMAQFIGITEDGIKYNLSKLIINNIIVREGPDNGGYWKIK